MKEVTIIVENEHASVETKIKTEKNSYPSPKYIIGVYSKLLDDILDATKDKHEIMKELEVE